FEEWKEKWHKSYSSAEEEAYRFGLFKQAYKEIEEHNSTPGVTSRQVLNRFTDLKPEEVNPRRRSLELPL
ncbi:hypothetical protein SELMODRAFT_19173, partial [Selaginella moellendorffii]